YRPTFELVAPGLNELGGSLLGEFPVASELIASYNSQLLDVGPTPLATRRDVMLSRRVKF
ncbi:hypothetical protein HAX54_014503, partial [Datura stramonium]|nr:hypothetical protein [Datura stramonium]